MKRHEVITELTREFGTSTMLFRIPFRAAEMIDYFPVRLTINSFKLGASDYDIIADELYCPCGATVRAPSDLVGELILGDLIEMAEAHIAEAHPYVRH